MEEFDPWYEMHKVECQNSEEKNKANNSKNRLIIEIISYSSLIDKKKAGILVIFFFGILLAPKTCVAISTYLKEEKSTSLNAWEYLGTYFSKTKWKEFFFYKKAFSRILQIFITSGNHRCK